MAQGWRQYLEAGMHVGEMTRAQAQRLVRQLVKEGQVARRTNDMSALVLPPGQDRPPPRRIHHRISVTGH